MSKALDEFFNLPQADDSDHEDDQPVVEIEGIDPMDDEYALRIKELEARIIHDIDHTEKMDEIYRETLQHSRDLMDLGHSTDPRSQRGIFEVAINMYKNALDAKNSKRDAQLDLLKHIVSQQKLELDKMKIRAAKGMPVDTGALVTDDGPKPRLLNRNDLLK